MVLFFLLLLFFFFLLAILLALKIWYTGTLHENVWLLWSNRHRLTEGKPFCP
jgi:hypothetical protein